MKVLRHHGRVLGELCLLLVLICVGDVLPYGQSIRGGISLLKGLLGGVGFCRRDRGDGSKVLDGKGRLGLNRGHRAVRSLRRGRKIICPAIRVDQGRDSWKSRFRVIGLQWSVRCSVVRIRNAQRTQRQVGHCESGFGGLGGLETMTWRWCVAGTFETQSHQQFGY